MPHKCIHSILLFFCLLLCNINVSAQGTAISNFGSNPGNINAYMHVPSNMPQNAPLVVVIHGCTQNASGFSNQTGWNTLANTHKFYVVHVEQKSANNSSSCFNYWETGDHNRNSGEGLSIKQTTDYMKANYSIDASRVFVSGLSAGGAMTAVMCCAYPDVFAAGASMAGLPYKVATSSAGVYLAAPGQVNKTPQEWGNLVRGQNPGYTGSWPRMMLVHGTSDIVINDNNSRELMEQFTNLHGADQTPDRTVNSFNGVSAIRLREYHDAAGNVVVAYYDINGMGHGIAVDPGSCYQQGGVAGSNSIAAGMYSSFWAAHFFGILSNPPFSITGPVQVTQSQQGTVYSVPNNAGSSYQWQVPSGATIVSGQGTNSITVNWGTAGGTITVVETKSNNCKVGPVELNVTVGGCPNTDCNGVCGGTATVDDCGVCSGGNTGKTPNANKDCSGVCFGNATLDCNNICNGSTPVDCNGVCGGTAVPDCNGVCGGIAFIDDCGVCSGGNTGHAANSNKDCAGVCFGTTVVDCNGVCGGSATLPDCNGVCGGTAFVDDCGVCAGGNTGKIPNANKDCAGNCFGTATNDCSGVCGGSGQFDCAGVCAGNALLDCAGICNGTAITDSCGNCLEITSPDFNNCEITSVSARYAFDNGLNIFPNPVSHQLNIILNNGPVSLVALKIIDIAGKTVVSNESLNNVNSFSLSLSGMNNGLYFCHLQLSNGKVIVQKIMKH